MSALLARITINPKQCGGRPCIRESHNEILSCCIGTPVSFGLTLPQLLSGKKTVTPRVWKDSQDRRVGVNGPLPIR